MKQKTEFNNWSISYLSNIYQCSKCKKRNNIIKKYVKNTKNQSEKQFQNCLYCGNPNYI
jgi:hypothetical protein